MKGRLTLLCVIVVACILVLVLTDGDDVAPTREQSLRHTVVDCALSRFAMKIKFLDVVSSICGKKCTAPSKPLFCDRERFLQTHGSPRFDFSHIPRDALRRNGERVDVIYSAIGERFYGAGGQSYVFDSIRQWRLFHSSDESRVFLVMDDARMLDPQTVIYQRDLDITLVAKSSVESPRLERYRRLFYIQGFMHPGGNRSTGNKHFNQLVTERFFAVAAVMNRFGLRHVLHVENDNMIYANMRRIVTAIARCGYDIASTAPSADIFVPGVVYIRDAASIERFVDYLNDFLDCGKSFGLAVGRQVTGKKDPYANDMTYLMNYYQLFGSAYVGELPAWLHVEGENCVVESSKQLGIPPFLFDSASFGQWYSFAALYGTSVPPSKVVKVVKRRYLDITPPPEISWVYEDGKKIPLWKGFRLVSLHIHAKNLHNFTSQ
ncbi:hypothetical protein DQ04_01801000 [Trypanosoma grayi]|uniref:hypothetical protein n=1 Tax=Trypanosoma grayi TaxID=71804 RepID=UPI0004F4484C|nr:hypothetical protein DQ04_01801000 [Trypanosoma grayi]KEG12315.1 hypothetical protein DQ04_01801000 [Trypanosoma grayi]